MFNDFEEEFLSLSIFLRSLIVVCICFFLSFVCTKSLYDPYQRVPNLVGGSFVDSQSSEFIDVVNPVSD